MYNEKIVPKYLVTLLDNIVFVKMSISCTVNGLVFHGLMFLNFTNFAGGALKLFF